LLITINRAQPSRLPPPAKAGAKPPQTTRTGAFARRLASGGGTNLAILDVFNNRTATRDPKFWVVQFGPDVAKENPKPESASQSPSSAPSPRGRAIAAITVENNRPIQSRKQPVIDQPPSRGNLPCVVLSGKKCPVRKSQKAPLVLLASRAKLGKNEVVLSHGANVPPHPLVGLVMPVPAGRPLARSQPEPEPAQVP